MPVFQCVQCGVNFERSGSKAKRPGRFCSRVCAGLHNRTGCVDAAGYRRVRRDGKQVFEHRWVVEQHLGRKLLTTEHVHHVNGNRTDNRLENLLVLTDSAHQAVHAPQRLDVAAAAQLFHAGLTCVAIGARLGVSNETVRTHLRRAGLDPTIRRGKQFAKRDHGRYAAD
jgi:hypothetical protein